DVAAVSLLLGRRELAGNHELEAGILPRAEASLKRRHVLESHLRHRLRRECRAVSGGAIGHNRGVVVRDMLLDARLEVATRDVDSAGDDSLLHLVLFSNVEHDGLGSTVPWPVQLPNVHLTNA